MNCAVDSISRLIKKAVSNEKKAGTFSVPIDKIHDIGRSNACSILRKTCWRHLGERLMKESQSPVQCVQITADSADDLKFHVHFSFTIHYMSRGIWGLSLALESPVVLVITKELWLRTGDTESWTCD